MLARYRTHALTVAIQLLSVALSVATFRLAATAFDGAGFGEYALARRALPIVTFPLLVGLGTSLPRFATRHRPGSGLPDPASYALATLLIAVPLLLIVGIMIVVRPSAFARLVFGDARFARLACPTLAAIIGLALHTLAYGLLLARFRTVAASLLQLINAALAPTVAVIASRGDVASALTLLGVIAAVTSLAATSMAVRGLGLRAAAREPLAGPIKDLLAFGIPRVPGEFALFGLFALPAFVAAKRSGIESAGLLSFGMSLVQLIGSLFASGAMLLLPITGRMLADGRPDRVARAVAWSLGLSIAASTILVVAMEAALGPIASLILGPELAQGIAPARWLLLGSIPYVAYIVLRGPLDSLSARPYAAINLTLALAVEIAWLAAGGSPEASMPAGLLVLGALMIATSLRAVRQREGSEGHRISSRSEAELPCRAGFRDIIVPLGDGSPRLAPKVRSNLFDDRPMTDPIPTARLRMEGITKHFGGVHALEGVNLEARAGEVHALCGENGAGKSTLMKILAGAITDYQGRIILNGQPATFSGPRGAEDAGIRIIYQELNLVPDLSVAANIFLGREKRNSVRLLDNRAMEREARKLFERLGTPISPRARVGDLRIGDQQMVEIAKALMFSCEILIMDEPTSALSDAEVARLYRVIDDLRKGGATILYISHKMNEVFTLSDSVTVLRDGRFVATSTRSQTEPAQVVRWMVGREIAALHFEPKEVCGEPRLRVESLGLASPPDSGRPNLSGITFDLHPGEILGVAGLLGAGRTELLESLFGASASMPTGSIALDGKSGRFRSPGEAIAAGVALVTEDRKNLGLFDQMSVGRNISLCRLGEMTKAGLVDRKAERAGVNQQIAALSIKTAGANAAILSLSGGNQQKCILGRWLLTEPKLLLLDEPTRGIDVGAKAEIYALMKRLADAGMAILVTSSELPELLAVCDRILVLCEGRLTADLPRREATEEAIMHAATRFLDRGAKAS
jgi:ribose transport system ATP-binding protein